MKTTELKAAWNRIKDRRIDSFSPTPTEHAGGLLAAQGLSVAAAIALCDEMGGAFWLEVKAVLEAVRA